MKNQDIRRTLTTLITEQKENSKNQKLDRALDSIRKKYGDNAIMRGSMMKQDYHFKK